MSETPELSKAARNEQRKLQATTLNAIGLAFVAIGFVQPVVVGDLSLPAVARVVIAGLIGYILHRRAMSYLVGLED